MKINVHWGETSHAHFLPGILCTDYAKSAADRGAHLSAVSRPLFQLKCQLQGLPSHLWMTPAHRCGSYLRRKITPQEKRRRRCPPPRVACQFWTHQKGGSWGPSAALHRWQRATPGLKFNKDCKIKRLEVCFWLTGKEKMKWLLPFCFFFLSLGGSHPESNLRLHSCFRV